MIKISLQNVGKCPIDSSKKKKKITQMPRTQHRTQIRGLNLSLQLPVAGLYSKGYGRKEQRRPRVAGFFDSNPATALKPSWLYTSVIAHF